MDICLIKPGVILETYLNIGKACASANQKEGWALQDPGDSACLGINPSFAGLLEGPGKSQGNVGHSTWEEVSGWGNNCVLTSS